MPVDEHLEPEHIGPEDELLAALVADLARGRQRDNARLPLLRQSDLGRERMEAADEAAHHPRACARHSAPDLTRLREVLAQVREQAYAIQDEELAGGLRSIAMPVLGQQPSPVAAVDIAVAPSHYDVPTLIASCREPLQAAATEMSPRLRNVQADSPPSAGS